ncbi:MAG: hypothetical protein J7M14_00090 [Planctomycetes bacterium]|nr:hypothetical protein [Planctomycetota bacterium]
MYMKRIQILVVVIVVALASFIVRLADLQIVKGGRARADVEELLRHTELIPAVRGKILDRKGRILAYDRPTLEFCLDYRFMTENARWIRGQKRLMRRGENLSIEQADRAYRRRSEKTWRLAGRLAGVSPEELKRTVVASIVRRVERIRGIVGKDIREQHRAHAIVSDLQSDVSLSGCVGASIRPGGKRWYPRGHYACHVIGLTKKVQQVSGDYRPGDTRGVSGVEMLCEDRLRGRRGYRRFKREGVLDKEVPPRAGRDVRLCIDIELQESLTALLVGGAYSGSIIVESLPRREVLAMVSTPTYDLNLCRYDKTYRQALVDNAAHPLRHRAVSELYLPGSTVKPLVAVAALTDGKITVDDYKTCNGYFIDGLNRFRCHSWRTGGHGRLNVIGAIKLSCNVFFYHVGEALGVRRLRRWFEEFGFCSLPGTGLGEESPGKVARRGTRGIARLMATGQGPIAVTPMHLAGAVSAIACGGEFRSPLLIASGAAEQTHRRIPGSEEAFRIAVQGMYEVVNSPDNKTVYDVFHGDRPLGFEVCGKTGTAQIERRPGDMLWFVGFAPRDKPQVAFVVMLEYVEGGSGGRSAAPLALEALRLCRKFGYLR